MLNYVVYSISPCIFFSNRTCVSSTFSLDWPLSTLIIFLLIVIIFGFSRFRKNPFFQNFVTGIPSEIAALPSNFHHGDTSNYVENSGDFADDAPCEVAILPLNFYRGESSNYIEHSGVFEDDMKPIIRRNTAELGDEQTFFGLPEQYEMNSQPVKDEYFVQPSSSENPADVNFSLGEQYLDATDSPPFIEGYLETNDLSKPIETDPVNLDELDEFLNFFGAEDDISQYLDLDLDSAPIMETENNVTEEMPHSQRVKIIRVIRSSGACG